MSSGPFPGSVRGRTSRAGRASLHSKAYVVDGKDLVIGSFNLDPRSIELNTELGLVIHSPQLAAQVLKMFEDTTGDGASYHVVLAEDGSLQWETEENGKLVRGGEPGAGLWRGAQVWFFRVLPVEDQL